VIEELIRRMALPWQVVAVYRDDGISGRLTRKRPGYSRMMKDLKSKRIQADLILVDTFERLTRSDEGAAIRRSIQRMGLLVLTADSGFADPTTTAGRALSAFESIRASEDGRIKAHNVLRGKRDAVRQKQWPGGAAPIGFRLRSVYKQVNGLDEIDYRVPEPDPNTRWIVEEIFRLADELGYGTGRIAKALNNDPRIPDDLKPFHPATIGETLDNEMHIGEYIWGRNCTGLVDEVRKINPLPKEEWIHIVDFCEPIIERGRWDRVQALRQARRDKCPQARRSQAANRRPDCSWLGPQVSTDGPGPLCTLQTSHDCAIEFSLSNGCW
jgi:DNA invertase Pin-like site-specific DNA recombinase